MRIDEIKTITKFIKFYTSIIDEQFNNFIANEDLEIYFSYECRLVNVQTNKIVKDIIETDYQRNDLFYYDYEYKINIPISKAYKYLLYNVKTNKLDIKKGIELKSYFIIAKNLEDLFQLLTDQESRNLIINNNTVLRIIKESFVFNNEINKIFDNLHDIDAINAFNHMIDQKNIYLPLLVYYDSTGDEFIYKPILEIEYNFIIDNYNDNILLNETVKNIDIIKNRIFEYMYSQQLSNLIKYFLITNTEPEYVSVKSMKIVTSLKLLFNFDYVKELLYVHFIDKILQKI